MDSAFAVSVVGVTNVASLAVGIGYGYTCALLESGFVECWGSNQYGQRGVGDVAARSYATTVTHADGAPFHDVKIAEWWVPSSLRRGCEWRFVVLGK